MQSLSDPGPFHRIPKHRTAYCQAKAEQEQTLVVPTPEQHAINPPTDRAGWAFKHPVNTRLPLLNGLSETLQTSSPSQNRLLENSSTSYLPQMALGACNLRFNGCPTAPFGLSCPDGPTATIQHFSQPLMSCGVSMAVFGMCLQGIVFAHRGFTTNGHKRTSQTQC